MCGQFLILGVSVVKRSVEPEFWWLCNQDDHHTCFPSPFTRDKDAQYTSRCELTCSAQNCKLAKCHFQMPPRQVIVLLANSVFSTWNVKSRVAPLYCYILEFKIDQYQLRFAKHNIILVCNEEYLMSGLYASMQCHERCWVISVRHETADSCCWEGSRW